MDPPTRTRPADPTYVARRRRRNTAVSFAACTSPRAAGYRRQRPRHRLRRAEPRHRGLRAPCVHAAPVDLQALAVKPLMALAGPIESIAVHTIGMRAGARNPRRHLVPGAMRWRGIASASQELAGLALPPSSGPAQATAPAASCHYAGGCPSATPRMRVGDGRKRQRTSAARHGLAGASCTAGRARHDQPRRHGPRLATTENRAAGAPAHVCRRSADCRDCAERNRCVRMPAAWFDNPAQACTVCFEILVLVLDPRRTLSTVMPLTSDP